MARATWSSKLGFIFAAAGSAVGLANIWRFPYIAGNYGGAAFILVYLLCLALIGFPVFIAEVLIGRSTHTSPSGAFQRIGRTPFWAFPGKLVILTGFLVSSFYSAVAAWILGYLVEAVMGSLSTLTSPEQAIAYHAALMGNPLWGLGFHLMFMALSVAVLLSGVRQGIERGNKIMMPMLYAILLILVVKGLTLPGGMEGLNFLLTPDWSAITPVAILIALGQSFFTLSLGQGTMVTYGSYMSARENVVTSCLPVVLMDTGVSIFASLAVFTIAFSAGIKPDSGPGLIFHTLPVVFSSITGGYFVAVLFFLLVFLAAITSQISAMEPTIAYLMDEYKWTRKSAALVCGLGALLLGVPSALSTSWLKDYTLFDLNFLDLMSDLTTSIMIPVGGFLAVILVAWKWGIPNALKSLREGSEALFAERPWIADYFWFTLKYSAPVLILFVFLNAIGIFY